MSLYIVEHNEFNTLLIIWLGHLDLDTYIAK